MKSVIIIGGKYAAKCLEQIARLNVIILILLYLTITFIGNKICGETTQFMMSYARQLPNDDGAELLLISAEEKVNSQFNTVEHELVRSTGINIDRIVFTTN